MRKVILFLIMSVLVSAVSFAAVMEKEIVGVGAAAGSSLKSKDAALERALRNAVEQGVGVLIDSETMVRNFKLLDDKIYAETKGYIKSYEIISDNEGKGGVYKIKVKANVGLFDLEKDIQALGIIREKMDYPRIIVLIDDYIDGVRQPRHVVALELEKTFMRNKFPVISKSQLKKINERDTALAYGNPKKAATLGRRQGAEVVIVGQATSDLKETSRPYGVSVSAYEANVEAKAVKVDNARVLALDTVNVVSRGSGRVPVANEALRDAARDLSESLMAKIVEAWRGEIYNEITILLICENATFEKAKSLKKALRGARDVRGVDERSLANDILELDVRFFGPTDALAAVLSGLKKPAVQITGKSANRIEARFL